MVFFLCVCVSTLPFDGLQAAETVTYQLMNLNVMTSEKTLFPNKVTVGLPVGQHSALCIYLHVKSTRVTCTLPCLGQVYCYVSNVLYRGTVSSMGKWKRGGAQTHWET